jgi:hypothetical protein
MLNFIKFIFNPDLFTFYFGGGGGSQPTEQKITQTTIPEYAKPYVEKMLGKSEALTETPYQTFGGERLAGFSPMQNQAFQGVQNMQTAGQLGQASDMAGMAGLGSLMAGQQYAQQATNPYAQQAYMSPYIQNALQPQMQEAARQSAIQGQQNQAQAVQQGAFGGSRSAIVEAERQRNLGTLQNQIYGTGMQNAFQNAQQAQQFGSTLGLQGLGQAGQAAATLGQLGQTQFGQQKDILQGQLSAGQLQQQQAQKGMDLGYQDFQNQRQYPYQQLAFMSDMLRGLPMSQTTQSIYAAPPSPMAQLAGMGMSAYGASKAGLFAKGGVVPTGLARVAADKLTQE